MFFARKKRDAALKDTIDRLGAVRDALRVLRVREEALMEELATYRPGSYARGDAYELQIRKKPVRRFNRAALPKHIREDDAYWTVDQQDIMTFVPLDPTQKTPTADQIADTYSETRDLPIGLSAEEADYGASAMPGTLPAPATPLLGPTERPDAAPGAALQGSVEPAKQALAAAEPAQTFDFSGVPRYRTGGKARKRETDPGPVGRNVG